MRICSLEGCGRKFLAKGLCSKHYQKQHYSTPEKRAQRNKGERDRYRKNPEKYLLKNRLYKSSHHEQVNTRRTKQQRARRKIDIQFKLSMYLRARLRLAVKNNQKAGSPVKDLGCTIEFFITWIESQFEPWMTWKNWGHRPSKEHPRVWHFDHRKPLSSFDLSDRQQFLEACHYTNLQPLESTKNLSKGAKG